MIRSVVRWGLLSAEVLWTAAFVLGVILHARWIRPSAEGVGPFPPSWQHWLAIALTICSPWLIGWLVHRFGPEDPNGIVWAVVAVCALAGWGALFPVAAADGGGYVAVTDLGFADRTLYTHPHRTIVFHNGRGDPITVCLGADGRCTDDPAGPAGLRGDGIVLAPDHRAGGGFAQRPATVTITLAGLGPEVPNRTATLHISPPMDADLSE